MARKSQRKHSSGKQTSRKIATKAPQNERTVIDYRVWVPPAILFLLSFLLYANTFSHDYALDDAIVITENVYTQEGTAGLGKIFSTDAFEGYFQQKKNLVAGGRYRPLSIATFALEIEFFGPNPGVSHFINVLLYALSAVLLFFLLRQLFPVTDPKPWWTGIPFLASLLYVVHPLHTEVVANIKGRDEILALLFIFAAAYALLRWVRESKYLWLGIGTIAFFLALLAKETALPFVLIVPLAIWFFYPKVAQVRHYLFVGAGLILPTALYLALRSTVVDLTATGTTDEILNDPFIYASFGERLATVAHTLGIYLGKLFLPLTLSHDYYFNQVPIIGWGSLNALLPSVIYLGLLGLTVYGSVRRHPAAFGMWWFFLSLALVSNIAVTVGTTMGERFLFVPSVGFLLAGVILLRRLSGRMQQPALDYAVVGVLAALFAVRTVVRNPDWKDNFTLFTTDVYHSPNSAKVRTAAGGALVDAATTAPLPPPAQRDAYLDEAIGHLQAATEIYPEHGQAWLLLGNAWFNRNAQYEKALNCFQTAIFHRPGLIDAYQNAAVTASKLKRYDRATEYYRQAAARRPQSDTYWYEAGIAYEEWGKPDSAIYAFERAVTLNPKNADALGKIAMLQGKFFGRLDQAIAYAQRAIALKPTEEGFHENLGIAYAMKGDFNRALQAFQNGLKSVPNGAKLYFNLGITYQQLGDPGQAQQNFERAYALNPALRPAATPQ